MNEVLIIEDDVRLGSAVQRGLEEQGYAVRLATTGHVGMELLVAKSPDLVILDLGLPDCDGISLLGTLRDAGNSVPVLIMTARDTVDHRVVGLEAGADDYLIKPFAFAELAARIHALLRRVTDVRSNMQVGDLTIDLVTRCVMQGGKVINLTPREFDLLVYLMRHKGETVSREMIAENVWREVSRFTSLDNVIDVHVSRLRRKLSADSANCPLQVVRGLGLRIGEP